ncbi:MAG: hypothetical protein PHS41_05690 [Victivallaceae bacterium]|nr:hypothetical protein [Victivallaceae bacterium]
MKIIRPKKIDSILHNPGCGMLYLQRGAGKMRFDQVPKDVWFLRENLTDKIAFAIPWQVIEPEEGRFLWNHPDWEGCFQSWIDAGFKVALEVRGMDTWGTFYQQGVPQWVFDAGAKYIDEDLSLYRGAHTLNFLDESAPAHPVRYPVYWDRIYLDKVRNLVNALGERYNNRPEIEWVNLGHMGRWGEMHLSTHSPLKPWLEAGLTRDRYVEAMMEMIQMYRSAFPDTQLCQEICAPVFAETLGQDYIALEDVPEIYEELARQKIIIKQNGIGKSWHGTRSRYIDEPTMDIFDRYYLRTKTACENLALPSALQEALDQCHISYWHSGGELPGLQILRHEENLPLPEKKVFSYTSFFPEEYAKMTVEDEKNLWRMMARRCGYRLEIETIRMEEHAVAIQWRNSGSAPCYEQLTLELALFDGKECRVRRSVPVAIGEETKVELRPEVVSPEQCRMELRLSTPRGSLELGSEGLGKDHWYSYA